MNVYIHPYLLYVRTCSVCMLTYVCLHMSTYVCTVPAHMAGMLAFNASAHARALVFTGSCEHS